MTKKFAAFLTVLLLCVAPLPTTTWAADLEATPALVDSVDEMVTPTPDESVEEIRGKVDVEVTIALGDSVDEIKEKVQEAIDGIPSTDDGTVTVTGKNRVENEAILGLNIPANVAVAWDIEPPTLIDKVFEINGIINSIVWGPWMLCLIVGTGLYLSIVLLFPQLRYFKISWKQVFDFKQKAGSNDKSISSFAALATAMAATVGTGNIAGVATALNLGGPGAAFWMLVSAFFGMATKFGEVALAVHFREKDEHGDWRGGTMYILEKGAGQKWLATAFAVFAFLASFGIGCAVQAKETANGLSMGFGVDSMYSAIALVILAGLVIIGGLKSLSTVTTYLVPFMAIFYILGSLIVLVLYAAHIPEMIGLMVKYAFEDPMAIPGAIAGWAVSQAIRRGIARGVFSNEAGLGSAPMVHATANVDHPIRQGLYGIFEVFVDTFIICAMTALVIMTTGSLMDPSAVTSEGVRLSGSQLSLFAFEQGIGTVGKYILSLGLALFSFTTILGWYWYGETAATYLFGVKFKPVMKCLWVVVIFIGAAGADLLGTVGNDFLNNVWEIADTLNALMAIPNLIGLLILSGVLRTLVKDFDEKRKSGELKI